MFQSVSGKQVISKKVIKMIHGYILLAVICSTAGVNIFTTPVRHLQGKGDDLFGQTIIESQPGVLVASPVQMVHCTMGQENCTKVNTTDQLIHRQRRYTKGSNNNNNNDNQNEADAGTEIAFVLDGSGSIDPPDFEKAKDSIINTMKKVWETCFTCNFAIVQYGRNIRTELSLLENKNGTKAIEKVKSIEQIMHYTKTASAINHVLEHVFVAENGSKEEARKIMIIITDGIIFLDEMKLTDVLNSPKMKNILRLAIGVGNVVNDTKAIQELKEIASDPDEDHLFFVDDYSGLGEKLSKFKKTITGIEDAGTEIAFVLDGSGSIDPPDFQKAKDFICNTMKKVWETCFTCNFAIVQYGRDIRTELSLLENENGRKAIEKVKSLEQIMHYTKTASAINHVLEHVFVAENGSKEEARKIMIIITDGRIFLDQMNLTDVLNSPKMKNILRLAIGVGDVANDTRAIQELKEIASDPDEDHLFLVDDYSGLDEKLLKFEKTITGIEDQLIHRQRRYTNSNNNDKTRIMMKIMRMKMT
ncbi:hypothetical protein COCON_G00191980 [Conger conger]|uniref:VWFA domain-containing protein n=1 Tax=Conger conger TaxID=82655 RepID=A0A9Q1D3B3_CONCO|nr:hypothetical protein COCON_G00191980 [Conger conger]